MNDDPFDDDDYDVHFFNHRVEVIDGEAFLVIDLVDGGAMIFTRENWLGFIEAGNDALLANGMQNAPSTRRRQ